MSERSTRIEHVFECAVSPVVRVAAVVPPRGRSERALAEAVAVGPGVAAITWLSQVEPSLLDDVDRVRLLQAWELSSRWLSAQHTKAVVGVAGARATDLDDFAREHVRVALVGCGGSARADVDLARALAGPLRGVRDAMEAGRISPAHARVVDDETRHLDPVTTRGVADEVLRTALPAGDAGECDDPLRACARCTPSQLRQRVRRAVVRADPAAAELAARSAARDRQVTRRIEPNAQASMTFTGPAVDVATVWTALDLRATALSAAPGDGRTLDQRRFDALVELCGEALPDARPRTRRGLLPAVHLYADAATWAGLAEEPVELAGYGPIPAGIARDHFLGSTWRAVVTDAVTGVGLAVSDSSYAPTPRTRRLLHSRDRHCTFPACTAAVWFCDADHGVPHADGGCTDGDNCGLLCRRHHRLKSFTDWRWQREPDGTVRWTDPHGAAWRRDPVSYPMPPPRTALTPLPSVGVSAASPTF